MTAIVLKRGELVTKDGATYWLLSACELQGVGYWCDTHSLPFATRQHLAEHCREEGEHRVSRWCPKHGFEAPAVRAKGEEAA